MKTRCAVLGLLAAGCSASATRLVAHGVDRPPVLDGVLDTGDPDDTAMRIGTTIPMSIATFDRVGEMDRGSDAIALVLAR
jgi:hypothetical protein